MFFSFIYSTCKGFILGGALCLLGHILDYTINFEHENRIIKEKPDFYCLGHKYILINLLVLSPITYGLVDNLFLCHNFSFSFIKYAGVLLTQNIGYYFVHKEMHRNKELFCYHKFHHKFDTLVSPSLGNAVTQTEFVLAYICPLLAGAFIFRPTELTYICVISTVGIGNLIIHTYEYKDLPWVPGFVSPKKHIKHHEVRNEHFAAPVLDIDALCEYEFVDA